MNAEAFFLLLRLVSQIHYWQLMLLPYEEQ
jgi:hypothetical protein